MRFKNRIFFIVILLFVTAFAAHAEFVFETQLGSDFNLQSFFLDLDFTYSVNVVYFTLENTLALDNYTGLLGFGVKPFSVIDLQAYGGIQTYYSFPTDLIETIGPGAHAMSSDYAGLTASNNNFLEGPNDIGVIGGGRLKLMFDIKKFGITNITDASYKDYYLLSSETAPRVVDNFTQMSIPAQSLTVTNTTRLSYELLNFVLGVENIFYMELLEGKYDEQFGDVFLGYAYFEHSFGKDKNFTVFLDAHAGFYGVHPIHPTYTPTGDFSIGLRITK